MDGRVWLATSDPNALTAVDADRPNDIATSTPTEAQLNLGAADRDWLWTTQFDTGLLERRSHDGALVGSVYVVDSPTGLVVGEDDVWVSAQRSTDPITRVSKATLAATATPWRESRVVGETTDAIWLGDHLGFDDATLVRLDRLTRKRSKPWGAPVSIHLGRRGVSTRYHILSDEDLASALRLYEADGLLAQVGEQFGVSAGTLLNAFRRAGAPTRPVGTNHWSSRGVNRTTRSVGLKLSTLHAGQQHVSYALGVRFGAVPARLLGADDLAIGWSD